jgi:hypothetical protein
MTDDEKDRDKSMGMSPLREAAIAAHEMYLGFREGGFSRSEALELVARIAASAMQNEMDSTPDE